MTAVALDPSLAALLRSRSARLAAAAQGLAWINGELLFGVPAWVCRAYVWAEHNRTDPTMAIARAHYGRDGEAWVAANTDCGAVRDIRAKAKRCAELAAKLAHE